MERRGPEGELGGSGVWMSKGKGGDSGPGVNKAILYNPSIFKQILSALNDQVRRRLAVLHTEKQSSLTGGLEGLYGWRAVQSLLPGIFTSCIPSSPSPFPSTFPSVFTTTPPKMPVHTRLPLSPPDCPGDALCTTCCRGQCSLALGDR